MTVASMAYPEHRPLCRGPMSTQTRGDTCMTDIPRRTGSIAQRTAQLQKALTVFRAFKASYLAVGHSEASAIIEAGRETVRKTGLTEIEAIINNSPLVQEYRGSRVTPRAPVLQMPARALQETAGAQGAPR